MAILRDPDARREPEVRSKLPVLGVIAAGRPIEAGEDREELEISELVPTGEGIYLLRVRGKSMIEDHIDDGDLVVVERKETAENGDIVVAILDEEEATLKRFYRENNRIRLQPANSNMEPIYVDSVTLRGVVRGVIRRFR